MDSVEYITTCMGCGLRVLRSVRIDLQPVRAGGVRLHTQLVTKGCKCPQPEGAHNGR